MILRFKVNQAEALRRGNKCPKAIVRVDVDPSTLDQETRDLIADRLDGINVRKLQLEVSAAGTGKIVEHAPNGYHFFPDGVPVYKGDLIMACEPTLDSLRNALLIDDLNLGGRLNMLAASRPDHAEQMRTISKIAKRTEKKPAKK